MASSYSVFINNFKQILYSLTQFASKELAARVIL